ncbi:unnamed protein product [Rhodiola kirilowii]
MAAQNLHSNPNTHQHAILVPYPLQGHVIPFANLALKLASKGFTITFVNTQSVHQKISKAQNSPDNLSQLDMFSEARESGFDIRYVTVSDGFPLVFDRIANEDQFWKGILHVFPAHVDELVSDLMKSSHPPVTCLLPDTFYSWGSSISNKYGLVHGTFWTEPVMVFTLYYHWDLLRKNGHFGSLENRKDVITDIPGILEIKPTDLMSFLQDTDISTVVHRIIDKAFKDVKKADFILSNTVQEFENDTTSALQSKQAFYSIGPVLIPQGLTNSSGVKTSLLSESDCNRWLNTKLNGSVLYVSFGSYAHVSKEALTEIAEGLVLSKVSFLWAVRADIVSSGVTDFLPVGFEENVKDQGLIVPWCGQVEVLSHPAVGGFLTHCGWNSILESIRCSVPLLCYPLLFDQFTNRKLVVDEWRIGIDLWYEKPIITREQVSTRIKILMGGKMSDKLRSQIKKHKDVMEKAISVDGSSSLNMNRFIDHMCHINK